MQGLPCVFTNFFVEVFTMKLKKFFAAVCAATVALSSLTLSAFAEGEVAAESVEIVLFDADNAPSGLDCGASGKTFSVSGSDLASWSVTSDNISDCSFVITYSETPTAAVVGINANGSDGSVDWGKNFSYNANTTSTTFSLSGVGSVDTNWDGVPDDDYTDDAVANGVTVQVKSAIISKIEFNDGSDAHSIYEYEGGVLEEIEFSSAAMTALGTASTLTVDVTGEGDGTISVMETQDWDFGLWDKEVPLVVTGADLSSLQAKSGAKITFKDFTAITKVTLTFELSGETPEDPEDPEDPSFDPEIDTSAWIIAAMGFTTSWGGWNAAQSSAGALTYTCNVSDIMAAIDISDIGAFGGIGAQVWGASLGDVISYTVVIKNSEGEVKTTDSGSHEVVETGNPENPLDFMLKQLAVPACGGAYSFAATDQVIITITGTSRASGGDTPGGDTPGGETPGGTTPGGSSAPSGSGSVSFPNSNTSTSTPNEPEKPIKFENSETDIKVEAPEGAFEKPEEVTFNAAPVAEETSENTFAFDLSFTDKDGNKVQPKSAVQVSVPLPAALTGKTVFVYHVENDGKYTEISCKVENGMVIFTASSFSKYIITSEKLTADGTPAPADPGTTSEPGNSGNPSTGVALSLLPVALASAAVVISRKRK